MTHEAPYLVLIPLLPLIGAAFNLLFARQIARGWSQSIAVGSVALAFLVVAYHVFGPLPDAVHAWENAPVDDGLTMAGLTQTVYSWIHVAGLELDLAFRVDTLTAVMLLVITGVGTLIHIYSTGYMHDEPRYAAYFGYLNLFTGAMLILVLADNLVVMFIGWEGVGLCSYLLIGFWFTEEANAQAGKKAFIVNRVGDFAFLLGIAILFSAVGTVDFRELQEADRLAVLRQDFLGLELAPTVFFACLFLFIGACGKSAQIPLYVWLPDAMAGPTPVSALIHAATMVTAGVYMIARLSPVYAQSAGAMAVVASVGAATALFAAMMAFAQNDLKKVLAYSTVSQLGFMFVGVGVGAYVAGIFHLMTHAFFKAGLFLGAGSVMHAMSGSGDITKMGGLRRKTPLTWITFLIFCLAIAGVPPFAGFFSKDEILAGAAGAHFDEVLPSLGRILWAVLTIAALGTAFYMFRLYFLVFEGHCRADEETRSHIHESPRSMTTPLLVLAGLAAVAGFLGIPHFLGPNFMEHWLEPSLVRAPAAHLKAGTLTVLLGVAVVAGAGGIALAWQLYKSGPSSWVKRLTTRGGVAEYIHDVVFHKFYVDELYDTIVVRPLRWFARVLFEVVDRFLIDLVVVNGSAFIVDTGGRVLRWLQNGQVQRYLVAVVTGGALVFFFASRPSVDIELTPRPDGLVHYYADIGSGAAAEGATLSWDFNADGDFEDSHDLQGDWDFGGPGEYIVTFKYSEPVFDREYTITKKVVVPEPATEEGGAL